MAMASSYFFFFFFFSLSWKSGKFSLEIQTGICQSWIWQFSSTCFLPFSFFFFFFFSFFFCLEGKHQNLKLLQWTDRHLCPLLLLLPFLHYMYFSSLFIFQYSQCCSGRLHVHMLCMQNRRIGLLQNVNLLPAAAWNFSFFGLRVWQYQFPNVLSIHPGISQAVHMVIMLHGFTVSQSKKSLPL